MSNLKRLYFTILVMITGVVVVALGGGLFGQQEPWILQWQHQTFSTMCHQMPDRSYWINGQPMAVCSRCFGIYASFFAGWLLLPFIDYIGNGLSISAKLLVAAIFINFLDVVGNLLGFWQNTLLSRMILGALIGSAAAALFSGSFFIITNKKSEERYGRVTRTSSG